MGNEAVHARPLTVNEDTLPEDPADVVPSQEDQIGQDEHGGGEG